MPTCGGDGADLLIFVDFYSETIDNHNNTIYVELQTTTLFGLWKLLFCLRLLQMNSVL